METTWQDVRYAVRQLRKSPGLVAVAVLSLALGIGANTAIFSLMDAVLFRQLEVQEPDELVVLRWEAGEGPRPFRSLWGWSTRTETGRTTSTSFSWAAFEQLRERNDVLSHTFAFFPLARVSVTVDGSAELADAQLVSGDYYNGLGVAMAAGRPILPSDDHAAAEPVAVISHAYWQRRFGGDPDAIGKPIQVNANPFTVVGVTAPGFHGTSQVGSRAEVNVPITAQPRLMSVRDSFLDDPDMWWLRIMGRLQPGVGEAQARAALDTILAGYVREELLPYRRETDVERAREEAAAAAMAGADEAGEAGDVTGAADPAVAEAVAEIEAREYAIPGLMVDPGGQGLRELRQRMAEPIFIMAAVVGLVLLIACVNVANLLLARARARERELAVRLSLGAGPRRLVRQLLTESVLLSSLGAVAGLVVAIWGRDLLLAAVAMRPGESLELGLRLDWRVLGFTAAVAVLTGVLFGLVPALRATRGDLSAGLKAEGDRAGAAGGNRFRLGKALVVVQVALSIVVLVAAGLFVRTLQNLEDVEGGFVAEGVLLFDIDPSLNGYEPARVAGTYERVLERLEAIPGVQEASVFRHSPVNGSTTTYGVWVPGYVQPEDAERGPSAYVNLMGPDFSAVMGIPQLLGRDIRSGDDEAAPPVAVVNQTFARRYFGDDNPVGRHFTFGDENDPRVQIVGVVGDARYQSLRDDVPPAAHVPFRQDLEELARWQMTLGIKAAPGVDPYSLAPAARDAVRAVDETLPVFNVVSLADQVARNVRQERQFARLSGFFGTVALLLACIGLYGVLSYLVVRRTREIGIRKALGAQGGDLMRMVLREMLLVAAGIGLGLAAAWGASRWLESFLYELEPTDPLAMAGAALVMLAVAGLAAWLPAYRASRVDPMVALRTE